MLNKKKYRMKGPPSLGLTIMSGKKPIAIPTGIQLKTRNSVTRFPPSLPSRGNHLKS